MCFHPSSRPVLGPVHPGDVPPVPALGLPVSGARLLEGQTPRWRALHHPRLHHDHWDPLQGARVCCWLMLNTSTMVVIFQHTRMLGRSQKSKQFGHRKKHQTKSSSITGERERGREGEREREREKIKTMPILNAKKHASCQHFNLHLQTIHAECWIICVLWLI